MGLSPKFGSSSYLIDPLNCLLPQFSGLLILVSSAACDRGEVGSGPSAEEKEEKMDEEEEEDLFMKYIL